VVVGVYPHGMGPLGGNVGGYREGVRGGGGRGGGREGGGGEGREGALKRYRRLAILRLAQEIGGQGALRQARPSTTESMPGSTAAGLSRSGI
jgi:hypothetical protein